MFENTFLPEQLQKIKDIAWEKETDMHHLMREAVDDYIAKYKSQKRLADGKTVMLVDDSTFMRTALRDMVQKNGYKVLGEAENGKLGAQYYSNFLVDYILLGIQMPIMDGMEFLKKIDKRPGCKVIVVTAAAQVKTVLETIENGADYFIIKPFSAEKMLDVLSMHDSEYFETEKLQTYSEYFYRTLGYSGSTRLSQTDIDTLKEI